MGEYKLALKLFRDDLKVTEATEPSSKKPRIANYVKQFFETIGAVANFKGKKVCKSQHL